MSDQMIDRAIAQGASTSCYSGVSFFPNQVTGTSEPDQVPRTMPAAIPADQAYYWSTPWQVDIRQSLEALRTGDYEEFNSDDPNDVVRWLLSEDED